MRKDVGAMSLISKWLQVVRSWGQRRARGPKANRRAAAAVELLDHRQLLSVNFSGNVATDFPAAQTPGVVVLPDNPNVVHPVIAPPLKAINPATGVAYVPVSGFDISELRVSYDAATDVLSVGINQPPSGRPGDPLPVIAGDADDNGNDGTVDPAITALPGFSQFQDFPDFGQSEHMAVFLDLAGTGTPDVVAGFAQNDPRSPKQYQVAQAVVNSNLPGAPPSFGTMLPQFTGNFYKVNSPLHPNLELDIDHFSQLYLQETGKPLNANTQIGMGAFAGSSQDIGISEAFFPEQPFNIGQATVPPHVCPPASPPVLINPHQNRHINTAHPGLIRVSVLGSSGFDVTQINPATVTFGGAHPVFSFTRNINRDEFLDETFVFKATDVHLPPGITQGTLAGSLNNGQTFSTSGTIFNRDSSFYTPGQLQVQQAKWQARGGDRPGLGQLIMNLEGAPRPGVTFTSPTATQASASLPTPQMQVVPAPASVPMSGVSSTVPSGPVVTIPRRQIAAAAAVTTPTPRIPTRLEASMNRFVRQGGLAASASAPQTAQ